MKKYQENAGATLIEVMGAILIFMIGIAALLGVFYGSQAMSQRANYAYAAYNIAKNHIEDLRSFSFTDLAVANETSSVVDQNGVDDPAGQYLRTTTVTTSYNGDANLTELDVQVWYVIRGVQSPNPVELTTVIFQNG